MQSLPFLPSPNPLLLQIGPTFVKEVRDLSHQQPSPQEVRERKKTLEMLKANNREIEKILTSLKVPRIEVSTLRGQLNLKFVDLISQI